MELNEDDITRQGFRFNKGDFNGKFGCTVHIFINYLYFILKTLMRIIPEHSTLIQSYQEKLLLFLSYFAVPNTKMYYFSFLIVSFTIFCGIKRFVL